MFTTGTYHGTGGGGVRRSAALTAAGIGIMLSTALVASSPATGTPIVEGPAPAVTSHGTRAGDVQRLGQTTGSSAISPDGTTVAFEAGGLQRSGDLQDPFKLKMWRNGKLSTLLTTNKTRGYPAFFGILAANRGRVVAFSTYAQDLGPTTLRWSRRCYVWSRKTSNLTLLASGQVCETVTMSAAGDLYYQRNKSGRSQTFVVDAAKPGRARRLPAIVDTNASVSADGRWYLYDDGHLRLHELATGATTQVTIKIVDGGVVSSNGRFVAYTADRLIGEPGYDEDDDTHYLTLWDRLSGTGVEIRAMKDSEGTFEEVAVTDDGQVLYRVLTRESSTVRLESQRSGTAPVVLIERADDGYSPLESPQATADGDRILFVEGSVGRGYTTPKKTLSVLDVQ